MVGPPLLMHVVLFVRLTSLAAYLATCAIQWEIAMAIKSQQFLMLILNKGQTSINFLTVVLVRSSQWHVKNYGWWNDHFGFNRWNLIFLFFDLIWERSWKLSICRVMLIPGKLAGYSFWQLLLAFVLYNLANSLCFSL